MAKRKAAALTAEKPEPTKMKEETKVLAPEDAHRLLGVHGPYDPPPQPPTFPSYFTFWDPGCSVRDTLKKQPDLFCRMAADWPDGQAFAKLTDSWKWRRIRLDAAEPGQPFDEQVKKLGKEDEVPLARELVVYLAVHALATGERLEIPRLRCRDVLPSGRRVIVGPFRDSGLEIANVSDRWMSPGIGLAAILTPAIKRK